MLRANFLGKTDTYFCVTQLSHLGVNTAYKFPDLPSLPPYLFEWSKLIWNCFSMESRQYCFFVKFRHYNDVTMGAIASQITSLTIVYSTVESDADQRENQSCATLAFVRGESVNSPQKWPWAWKQLFVTFWLLVLYSFVNMVKITGL